MAGEKQSGRLQENRKISVIPDAINCEKAGIIYQVFNIIFLYLEWLLIIYGLFVLQALVRYAKMAFSVRKGVEGGRHGKCSMC